MELDLAKILNDPNFDESSFQLLEDYLGKFLSKSEYFIKRFHMKSEEVTNWDVIYLVILSAFPYEPAIQHALKYENWELPDFSTFSWFNGGNYTAIKEDEYHDWLSKVPA
ncbi:hypothetical protein [Motilimonas sp. E26]|uniref:hypothetical protein n=1 Tax=Motilimonas sp. E26 TaxID=2865674 RepID=UPI001E64AC54|nr:hypothetical protein [Motilimonas sp. E26]MCE0557460.1 hypothetical protein [Motilimonas sp. E26]